MKRIAVLSLGLLLGGRTMLRGQTQTNLDELVQREGVYVQPRTLAPYSGPVASMWSAAMVKEQGTLRNGRWDGVHETFYANGQLESRETYKNGVLEGPFEAYFRKGTVSDKGTYHEGRLDGLYESYWSRMQGMMVHVNEQGQTMTGDLAERGTWTAGQPCGQWYRFMPKSGGGLRTAKTVDYPPCPAGRD
jgi:antitoxin component YwqK of YwqJK toxin-antitoxin module